MDDTSAASRAGSELTTGITLSSRLQGELQYEKNRMAQAGDATPDFLKTFTEQGAWSVNDVRGNDDVTLTRTFGDENIRIIFSVADIEPEDETIPPAPMPIHVSVSITKNNGPGAINVNMTCQEGAFSIENISFYDDAMTSTELTTEADRNRRRLYIGPQFDTLDVALQDSFNAFFAERGINNSVASFIPQYAEYKEQQEYVNWLGKVKSFIDL